MYCKYINNRLTFKNTIHRRQEGDIKTKYTILCIDDEPDFRKKITDFLSQKYRVANAVDGQSGYSKALELLPDLILLDLGLPKLDGFHVCKALRSNEATSQIPVLIMTGSMEEDLRIDSYMTGADDFVYKPFTREELLARVASKIRRIEEREVEEEVFKCGNMVIDSSKLEVSVDGSPVKLSVLEFNLLKYLVKRRDEVISRKRILEVIWRNCTVRDRTVDSHIASLRRKLAGFQYQIVTVYNAGYIVDTQAKGVRDVIAENKLTRT